MKVKILKLNKKALVPVKHYNSDACYDVYATSCEEVAPNVYRYGLGIALQIERDTETIYKEMDRNKSAYVNRDVDFKNSDLKLSIDFRPRSSVWKTGMVLSNATGTIDEHYTAEIMAVFYHVMPEMPKYEIGDRVGQIKIGVTFPIDFIEVESLDATDRSGNGYGSTGK